MYISLRDMKFLTFMAHLMLSREKETRKNLNVYIFISIFHLTEIFFTKIIRNQYLRKNNPST